MNKRYCNEYERGKEYEGRIRDNVNENKWEYRDREDGNKWGIRGGFQGWVRGIEKGEWGERGTYVWEGKKKGRHLRKTKWIRIICMKSRK